MEARSQAELPGIDVRDDGSQLGLPVASAKVEEFGELQQTQW